MVTKLLKIWVWDLGSGIRDPGSGKNLFWIPDSKPIFYFMTYRYCFIKFKSYNS
jgi:hypothetical protein